MLSIYHFPEIIQNMKQLIWRFKPPVCYYVVIQTSHYRLETNAFVLVAALKQLDYTLGYMEVHIVG